MVCSKQCIKDYNSNDLSDKEKICISRCFGRKNDTFHLTLDYLGKMGQVKQSNE